MNTKPAKNELDDSGKRIQRQSTIILLTSTLLMITWKYFGTADFYRQTLSPRCLVLNDIEYTAAVYMFLSSFLLLAVIPALIVKFVLKQRLSEFGICVGDLKSGALALLVFVPLFLLASYVGTRDPAVREFYPINRSADLAFLIHVPLFFCFYLGWEFHFRGFLQFGLQGPLGWKNAILIQVMASTLMHIGLPTSETYMAIIAGVLWGVMAYRTRSILAGLTLHFLLGISADYFLLYLS